MRRICKLTYSNGTIKYSVEEKNYRNGYDSMYDMEGNEILFDTFEEAFFFVKPEDAIREPFVINKEVIQELYY